MRRHAGKASQAGPNTRRMFPYVTRFLGEGRQSLLLAAEAQVKSLRKTMSLSGIELVKEFYARMNTNDFHSAAQLLSDEYVLEWPQSKERIRGRDNFVAMNEEYPAHGRWRFTVNRIVGNETDAVSDVSVTDGTQMARAITFTTVCEGQIIKQVEYWPENYQAPENRRHLVELI